MIGRNLREHPAMSKYQLLAPTRQELDFSDFQRTKKYFQETKPDFVVHTAAHVGGIHANIQHPVTFLIENLDINRNVILAAKQSGVKRLLNLACSCIYPHQAPNPLSEKLILQGEMEPTNEGYALAKVIGIRLCQYIRKENPEFNYKTIIPCGVYGRYDNFNPAESHLIPAIIHKLHLAKIQNLPQIDIWGTGEARRELLFAGDLADCLYRCIENFELCPDVMNVGLGFDHTVNEYYAAASKVIGYKGQFVHDLNRPVGMKQKLVQVDLMKQFGWSPRLSLEEGMKATYEYYLNEIAPR